MYITLYPYQLSQNPYPSSPTPTQIDARVLGGKRHKDARSAVISCIEELGSKVSENATEKDFRLITVIQDVGSGKTHLALHIRGLQQLAENTIISYIDLSQISPRTMQSLYSAMLGGFSDQYISEVRNFIINYLADMAAKDNKTAKKIFNYGFFDSLSGKTIADKARSLKNNEFVPNYSAIKSVLLDKFSPVEIEIIKLIIEGKFRHDALNVGTLEDIITSMSAISMINLKFLGKLTIFQIDEFDADEESINFIKAVVNAHLPSTVLMLILTPSSYEEIRKVNASVFDRLEKANYKIDLAGSNTFEEVVDIIAEYIRFYNTEKIFTTKDERDLAAKIKVIYDEFPDFRNIRSMINILYHATENASKRNIEFIDEQAIDDTIKNTYPGLRIRGSIMDVPISEFIKIRRNCNDVKTVESDLRDAVKNLVNYAHELGSVARTETANGKGNGIDIIYNDPYGTKVAVAVVINKDHSKSFEQISNTVKSTGFVDKLVILTNANTNGGMNGTTFVNVDRCKMVDLIYFSSKYKNNEILNEDLQRALMLAKSIKLC